MTCKTPDWNYSPGQHPAQKGEAYIALVRHLMETHNDGDRAHVDCEDELERICAEFDEMEAADLKQVFDGIDSALGKLLNALIVVPARAHVLAMPTTLPQEPAEEDAPSHELDATPPMDPPLHLRALGPLAESTDVHGSEADDDLEAVFDGPVPYYRRGLAYIDGVFAAHEETRNQEPFTAAELFDTADKLLWPLGNIDEPEELRDFIAGVAAGAEHSFETLAASLTDPTTLVRRSRAQREQSTLKSVPDPVAGVSWRDLGEHDIELCRFMGDPRSPDLQEVAAREKRDALRANIPLLSHEDTTEYLNGVLDGLEISIWPASQPLLYPKN